MNSKNEVRIVKFYDNKFLVPISKAESVIRKVYKLNEFDELRKIRTSEDKFGIIHTRYQQYFKGIRVESAEVIVHQKGNIIKSINGELISTDNIDIQAIITTDKSIQVALSDYSGENLAWNYPVMEEFIRKILKDERASFYPKPELVVKKYHDKPYLAYKLTITTFNPFNEIRYFINAMDGEIISKENISTSSNAIGTAVSKYSGNISLNTDSYSNGYRLFDNTRGEGIWTKNADSTYSPYPSTTEEFQDNDNNWNEHGNSAMDDAALDAHYGAQKTWDYFKTRFNRDGFDDDNSELYIYIHYGIGENNSWWINTLHAITMGDGNGTYGSPFTSCDAVAHEFAHGLLYSFEPYMSSYGEPGSIMEGLGDIWGACVENYANISGNLPWTVGEDYNLLQGHAIDLQNPNNSHYHLDNNLQNPPSEYPDSYLGPNWYSGNSDNNGIHYNSTVISHWFTLLALGGAGTNDDGRQYLVNGIGINKAAEIVYNYYEYLTPNSDFSMISTYTTYIAAELYGNNSNEAIQTWNSWFAVGVFAVEVPNLITGGSIVCGSGEATYSLPPEFNGTSIYWSVSSNLSILSGQGSRIINVEYNDSYSTGNGSISATYNHGNGNIVSQINVWVGSDLPDPVNLEIKGENYEFVEHTNDMWELCPNTVYRIQAHSSSSISQWDWTIPESWELLSSENSPEILIQTGDYIYWEDEVHIDVYNYPCNTWIYFADYLLVTEPPYGCGESKGFRLYPNPASENVEVELFKANNESTIESVSVSIIDNLGKVYYFSKENTTRFNIPISKLRNGKYVIVVFDGKSKYSRTLVINH